MSDHESVLHVYSRSADVRERNENTFIIESEINAAEDDAHMEVLASLTEYVNQSESSPSIAQGLLPYLVFSRYGKLPARVIAYRRLRDRIIEEEHIRIVPHEVDECHKPIIDDVARSTGIAVGDQTFSTPESRLRDLFSIGLIATLIEQVFSVVYSRVKYSTTDPDLVSLTSSGRDRNESLVINELSLDTTVVTSVRTTAWLRRDYETDYDNHVTLRPLNSYASPRAIYKQVKQLWSLSRQSWAGKWEIESGLTERLAADMDVTVPRTVHHACSVAMSSGVRQVLSYYLVARALDEEKPTKVVVRGDSPRPRLALEAASRRDRELYYLPHSITCGYEVLPAQQDTTQFMPGPYEVEYLQNSSLKKYLPNLVPTGRPIHEEYRKNSINHTPSSAETLTILVATQPFDDFVRKRFVDVVLNGLASLPDDHEVIIKIHPSESTEFYEDWVRERDADQSVVVESGPVEPFLNTADLSITINSNVGFESMMTDTPLVAYNEWGVTLSVFPYMKHESVPVARNESDFEDIISDLTRERLQRLTESQVRFVESGYYFEESVLRIKTDLEKIS